jgi:hypothetical protein
MRAVNLNLSRKVVASDFSIKFVMYFETQQYKLPSVANIGSVRNLFIGAAIASSLSMVILITLLPLMLCRLNALYDAMAIEKSAFHVSRKTST